MKQKTEKKLQLKVDSTTDKTPVQKNCREVVKLTRGGGQPATGSDGDERHTNV